MKYDENDKRLILRRMSDNRLLRTVGRIVQRIEKYYTLDDIEAELRRRVAIKKNDRDKTGTPD
jgi:hypothetical protein